MLRILAYGSRRAFGALLLEQKPPLFIAHLPNGSGAISDAHVYPWVDVRGTPHEAGLTNSFVRCLKWDCGEFWASRRAVLVPACAFLVFDKIRMLCKSQRCPDREIFKHYFSARIAFLLGSRWLTPPSLHRGWIVDNWVSPNSD